MSVRMQTRKASQQVKDLALHVLGPFHVTRQGKPVTNFRSDKVRALLVYLAIEHDRPRRRDELAGLLWPDMSDQVARRNLRLSLHRLREALGDEQSHSLFFEMTRDMVQCRPDVLWVDALAFETLALTVQHHSHEAIESCTTCMEHLTKAVELYRGDFLEGFCLKECPDFSEWMTLRRERWHAFAMLALFWLAEYHRHRGHLEMARRYAQRQIELEPWREEAHRQIIDILARLGQRSAALAQYETCRRILAEEFGVEPDERTQHLYRRLCRPPCHMLSNSLPIFPTPFVGREREMAWLGKQLTDPRVRLITVVGPPGVGKTRLALEAATRHSFAFLHGVCFVPLTGERSPERLLDVLASQLGGGGLCRHPPLEQVFRFLSGREMLLLLDDIAGLLAACEQDRRDVTQILKALLYRAPGVKVLITSREPLHLQWEWILRLEGLQCSEVGDDVLASPAGRLFVARAQQRQWDFAPRREAQDIARICRLVEGLPLGIELAAAWSDRFSCHEIANRLEHHAHVLTTPFTDVEAHHRSLWAAFESSWHLLSPEQQQALRRLAIFTGRFTVHAAREVAGVSEAMLTTLADKSLLRQLSPHRYEMQRVLRPFAREHLRAFPTEEAEMARRYARYTATFAPDTSLPVFVPTDYDKVMLREIL
nr:BTAD domain-containing putative transcriptional regulator [Ardenticatena sp.]